MQIEMERVKVVIYPDGRLDTENAARFLGLSPKTLAIMRSIGNGPRFVKRGRVFYFLDDLQAWIAERPRVRSAAQARFWPEGVGPMGARETAADRSRGRARNACACRMPPAYGVNPRCSRWRRSDIRAALEACRAPAKVAA